MSERKYANLYACVTFAFFVFKPRQPVGAQSWHWLRQRLRICNNRGRPCTVATDMYRREAYEENKLFYRIQNLGFHAPYRQLALNAETGSLGLKYRRPLNCQ